MRLTRNNLGCSIHLLYCILKISNGSRVQFFSGSSRSNRPLGSREQIDMLLTFDLLLCGVWSFPCQRIFVK